jgi:hypothetical protein
MENYVWPWNVRQLLHYNHYRKNVERLRASIRKEVDGFDKDTKLSAADFVHR